MSNLPPVHDSYDAIVIGGGFYGCCLALSQARDTSRVLVIEKARELLTRASYVNQARVHNGYHYPRSIVTAMRSAVNFRRFADDFDECIDRTFLQVYAIARSTSKVTSYQFKKFCENVGIPLRLAPSQVARLFNNAMIEAAFCTEEYAFDAVKLREQLKARLQAQEVEVAYGCQADKVMQGSADMILVRLADGREIAGRHVFNCAYSGVNGLLARSGLQRLALKHEITEIALIEVPDALKKVGITVMDGPFFSAMPFPALSLHSLSHVRYTPHESWNDLEMPRLPPEKPAMRPNSIFMLKDAQRYLPILGEAQYVRSLFETKTVLVQNEVDDGRPILCRRDYGLKNFSVVLGAKIDNIYDVLHAIGTEAVFKRCLHESCC